MIWVYARPEGRYILLKSSKRCGKSAPIYSPAKVPAFLHACHESRMIALKWYQLSFATNFNKKMQTYFDHSRDGIYAQCYNIQDCGAMLVNNMMNNEGLKLIKRMVWEGPLNYLPLIQIVRFPAIKNLILVRGKRIAPRAEVTLSEMTTVIQPPFDKNMTIDEHWMCKRTILYQLLLWFFPKQASTLRQLESISHMELAELQPCGKDDICPCCH